MKPADMFPTNCRFEMILCNSGYKKCLQALIKTRLPKQLNFINQELVYSVGVDCVSLSTWDTKDNFSFSQGEADTIILSVYAALWLQCSHSYWCRRHRCVHSDCRYFTSYFRYSLYKKEAAILLQKHVYWRCCRLLYTFSWLWCQQLLLWAWQDVTLWEIVQNCWGP